MMVRGTDEGGLLIIRRLKSARSGGSHRTERLISRQVYKSGADSGGEAVVPGLAAVLSQDSKASLPAQDHVLTQCGAGSTGNWVGSKMLLGQL